MDLLALSLPPIYPLGRPSEISYHSIMSLGPIWSFHMTVFGGCGTIKSLGPVLKILMTLLGVSGQFRNLS